MAEASALRALVLDLGGVVVDWDPRHLYRKLFAGDDAGMERFLAEVCNQEWNERQDAGRPFAEGIAELQADHPGERARIAAYWERWDEMVSGPIEGMPELLGEIAGRGWPLYALSNWSAETWPRVVSRLPVLDLFEACFLSGQLGVRKPEPAIYRHVLRETALSPWELLFVDDLERNLAPARELGFRVLRFRSARRLRRDLARLGIV